ncbi:MAG: phosphatidylserine decarboxylase, partial [Desulfomonilaceae bacterium]
TKGDRFGLIKFGSRVDIYLPKNFVICTSVGSKVRAGVTVIARLANLN